MLKQLARLLLGDYQAFWILARQSVPGGRPIDRPGELVALQATDLAACAQQVLAEQAWYLGPEAKAFGWRVNGELQALCVYWHGARYRPRNFWPLAAEEAKLVQVITAPCARGRGFAGKLIAASADAMAAEGFERLLARVWLTNTPSLRAFRSAGWSRVALVVTGEPPWLNGKPVRLRLGQAPRG